MIEWREYDLGDVCDIIDSLHKTPTYSNTGFPMVRVTDIKGGYLRLNGTLKVSEDVFQEFSKKHKPKVGDIVMSRVGSYGISSLVKKQTSFCLGQNTLFIAPKQNPYFIYYFLNSPRAKSQIEKLATGSTQKTISLKSIKQIKVLLPDLSTQTALAEILSSLDDKIELNNQINQNLEALAQAIFKRWFVDFEFPNENGQLYKSSGGEMVESKFGEIPKGWEAGKVSDIIEINPTEKILPNSEASYLDMASLPTQGSWPDKPIQRTVGSGMKFRNGDTLFARITPCLENGKTCFVQCLNDNEVAWGSTEFIVLRPKNNWPKEFAYLLARDDKFRQFAIQGMTGTSGRQRVQGSRLAEYDFVYPKDERILGSLKELLNSFFLQIKLNSEESENLADLRDTLLPKLIAGRLEVRDIEKVLEEV